MEHLIKLRPPIDVSLLDVLNEIDTWKAEGAREVLVDMEEVDNLNSLQIGRLVRLALACRQESIRVRLFRLHDTPRRAIIASGVAEMLGIAPVAPPNFDTTQF